MTNMRRFKADSEYMKLVSCFDKITSNPSNVRKDRTGVGTYSLFSPEKISIPITHSFPILLSKKINFKHIVHEVIWNLKGDTNVKYLEDNGIKIWSDWADENGDLGPIYGKQWRRFEGPDGEVDQIKSIIETLKNDPYSRRNLLLSYNPADRASKAPQGCHTLAQFYFEEYDDIRFLSVQVYQRSGDLMLGIPYDIAMYGLLLELICREVGNLIPKDVKFVFGDLHIYANHLDGLEQLKSQYEDFKELDYQKAPIAVFKKWDGIDNFKAEDVDLIDYNPRSAIKFKIAV